jgi:hypothetical protein
MEYSMARTLFTRPCIGCGKDLKMVWSGRGHVRCHPCQLRHLKNENLIKNHKITIGAYEEKLKEQNGVCACCFQEEQVKRKDTTYLLKVVKQEDTFKLLCYKCNRDKR